MEISHLIINVLNFSFAMLLKMSYFYLKNVLIFVCGGKLIWQQTINNLMQSQN